MSAGLGSATQDSVEVVRPLLRLRTPVRSPERARLVVPHSLEEGKIAARRLPRALAGALPPARHRHAEVLGRDARALVLRLQSRWACGAPAGAAQRPRSAQELSVEQGPAPARHPQRALLRLRPAHPADAPALRCARLDRVPMREGGRQMTRLRMDPRVHQVVDPEVRPHGTAYELHDLACSCGADTADMPEGVTSGARSGHRERGRYHRGNGEERTACHPDRSAPNAARGARVPERSGPELALHRLGTRSSWRSPLVRWRTAVPPGTGNQRGSEVLDP